MNLYKYLYRLLNFAYQVFFQFPISALTIPRQRQLRSPTSTRKPDMHNRTRDSKPISDHVYEACTSSESVSSILARDPTVKPGDARKKLFGSEGHKSTKGKSLNGVPGVSNFREILQRAAECGKWGPTQPSELFLRVSLATTGGL
jgi:hypothetical protein